GRGEAARALLGAGERRVLRRAGEASRSGELAGRGPRAGQLVSDARLRELVRLAEKQGDAAAWERAARELVRAEKWDEAGRAVGMCQALGGEPHDVEDALEPESLDAFELRLVADAGFDSLAYIPGTDAILGVAPPGASTHVVRLALDTAHAEGPILVSRDS